MNSLKEKSTLELKGLAYDLSMTLQQYNQTLQVINNEINERAREELTAKQSTPLSVVKTDEQKSPD